MPNPSSNSSAADTPDLRFLIAEDDADLRFVLTRVVSETFPQAAVAAFPDGLEALRDFDAHGADLVISNHSMPVMNGPDFVRHLRERSNDLPILMVSDSPEARQEGAFAGINRFLDKTEIMARLVPMIRGLLEKVNAGGAFSQLAVHR